MYGAIDRETGITGDAVYETIPEEGRGTLYPLPDHLDERLIVNLSSLLHPPDREHSGLETAYTDMAKLFDRLCRERFDGAIRLEDDERLAFFLLDKGTPLLDIFSEGWDLEVRDRDWRSWIDDQPLTAHVERRRTILSSATYRRELEDLRIQVDPSNQRREDDTSIAATSGDLEVRPSSLDERSSRASTVWRDIYESDLSFQLLEWMRDELSGYLQERGRLEAWKYLVGWTDEIAEARLYHKLERPEQKESDFFDLVTVDTGGKVLHVARRLASCSVRRLNMFIDGVEAAKKARIKTGDIGGAVLIAEEFDDEAIAAYEERVRQEESSWFFNFQESMTGYEGFVRMGTRRGFHLLLVRRKASSFEPILPPKE